MIISALIEEREKINGLRLGADDYLAKPLGVGERHGLGYEFVFPSSVARDYTAKQ